MINRLEPRRRRDGSIGLMGHVIADYPSPVAVRTMIAVMVEAGAEVIEIQIPFSEPMADGPVFLEANHRALAQGVGYRESLALMAEVTARYPECAFVFMSYLNVPFKRGYEVFARDLAASGARGVIVPDLPIEHAAACHGALAAQGLANVCLIAPNCPDGRLDKLTAGARGLIYAVARRGVTGERTDFGAELGDFVGRIRTRTEVPLAVGFGVRGGEDVRRLRGIADLAVVGTASLTAWMADGEQGFRRRWGELARATGG